MDLDHTGHLEDNKLYEMKSHDFHVFMRTFIPPSYRDLLPNEIWNAEINHFFKDICSNKLHTQYMEKLETNIV
jgi:hypothetical protein